MPMRKVFWVSAASGALLVGAAFSAAWYAARQPQCVLARVLDGAGHAAETLQPVEGFGPALARLDACRATGKNETNIAIDGIPDEPMAADEQAGVNSNGGRSGAIVIVEDDMVRPVGGVELPPDTATPPAPPAAGAPASMPYCEDAIEVVTVLPMPRELPAGEEEQEGTCEADVKCMIKSFLRHLQHEAGNKLLEGLGVEQEQEATPTAPTAEDLHKPQMREDVHYHHHHSGCPYTGRGYIPCPRPANVPVPVPQPQKPGEPEHHSSALELIRKIKSREASEGCPQHPRSAIDTMEYRLSDRPQPEPGPDGV